MILLDIFSYSCMNCRRSLEYISRINSRYKRYGLKTVLVHVPEWQFEKNNVKKFIREHNIKIPLILDTKKRIIKKFAVNFWPAQILLDNDKLIYRHIGEGGYSQLEEAIRIKLKAKTDKIFNTEPEYSKHPCTYFGRKKKNHRFAIEGRWRQYNECIIGDGKIHLTVRGKKILLVAASEKGSIIYIRGNDFRDSIPIKRADLYLLKEFRTARKRRLSLIIMNPTRIYSLAEE